MINYGNSETITSRFADLAKEEPFRRITVHSMCRRCRNWNYRGTGHYLITLVQYDRSRPLLGRLRSDVPEIELSELGRRIKAHFLRISEYEPSIEVLGVQVMPEHMHGILHVRSHLSKKLGEYIRGFKIGATKIAREMGVFPGIDAGAQQAHGLFADSFTDTILFDNEALARGIAYIHDNPRRLWVKRATPAYFTQFQDIVYDSPNILSPMHFVAIGNRTLLESPEKFQVQCSRHDFIYDRDSQGRILHDSPPHFLSPHYSEIAGNFIAAAEHGAVLVSPCISDGEKEIVRQALMHGSSVVALRNKGFDVHFKPGGLLFDYCSKGKLLILAPSAWPYTPANKPITRIDACVLNRIAQVLSDAGAAEIRYRGLTIEGVDELVYAAMKSGGII